MTRNTDRSDWHSAVTRRRMIDDEAGSATVWGLLWLLGLFALAGVAVDTSNAWRMHAILQSTADAAAHAGAATLAEAGIGGAVLAARPETAWIDPNDAKEVAQGFALLNMPPRYHGTVLIEEDVLLGYWDENRREFVPNALVPDAVYVTLRRSAENTNSLPTQLLHLVGFDAWDISVYSIARMYRSPRAECVDPLLAAQARVDVQTNDVYVGICVYADADVAIDTTEPWLSDEVIDLVDRVILSGATGEATDTVIAMQGELGDLFAGEPGSPVSAVEFSGLIDELRASADVVLTRDGFESTVLTAGTTYYVECADDQVLHLPKELDLGGIVLLSECPVRAEQDLSLYATVMIANLDALRHIELTIDPDDLLPPVLELGAEERCKPGDGVQIIVFVDFDTAARFTLFDPEIYPLGEALVHAHREQTEVDGEVIAHVGAYAEGDVVTGAGLDGLLGLCVSAQYMLHADAVTLAQ